MKKTILMILTISYSITMLAQSKIDLQGQAMLRQYRMEQRSQTIDNVLDIKSNLFSINDKIVVFVSLVDGKSINDLADEGVEILDSRGDLALVRVSINDIERFSNNPMIKKVEFGKKIASKLKAARKASGIDMVHNGLGLPQSYKGQGVVTGLFDVGVDPNHIAFNNADQSQSRVKRLWRITGQNGLVSTYDTPEKIAKFSTDDAYETHGTHVAGIMSGGYMGNGYYGVAPESDIVMSCGDLYDSNVVLGALRMLEYAQEENKPAVINLSVGVNSGPHDGSDYFCRYMEQIGEETIVCISAGNEGSLPIALKKEFTDQSLQVGTFIESMENDGVYSGSIDCWSADDNAITLIPVIYDLVNKEIVYQMPACEESSRGNWTYVSSKSYYEAGDLSDDVFDNAFVGYMGYASVLVSDNNRYEVMMYYSMKNASGNDGRYVPGIVLEGNSGQTVFCYSDGAYIQFTDNDIDGWNAGTTDGTISNMACGNNVIVVGSYDTSDSFTTKDGYTAGYPSLDVNVGKASTFSSYGRLYDGRELPHILAPGCIIVSAYSNPYMKNALAQGAEQEQYMAAKVSKNSNNYYWGAMLGTSMASPFMAGSVALWLQADSTLTYNEVLKIAMETATSTESLIDPVQCGAGKLSVYNGLKMVLDQLTGIGEIVDNQDEKILLQQLSDDAFEIYVAGESQLDITMFDMCGRPVYKAHSNENNILVETQGLGNGVYVLKIQGNNSQYSRRVLVK